MWCTKYRKENKNDKWPTQKQMRAQCSRQQKSGQHVSAQYI